VIDSSEIPHVQSYFFLACKYDGIVIVTVLYEVESLLQRGRIGKHHVAEHRGSVL
jgi:hypothetical protein